MVQSFYAVRVARLFPNLEKRGGDRNDTDRSADASYIVVLGCLWCPQFDTKEITIP